MILLISICGFVSAIDISDCNYTIGSSGTYNLTQDINTEDNNVTDHDSCIFIAGLVSDVTIDCQGYTVSGSGLNDGNMGIYSVIDDNVTIQNCNFTNIKYGIKDDGDDHEDGTYAHILDSNFYDLNYAIYNYGDLNIYDVNFTTINSIVAYDSNTLIASSYFEDVNGFVSSGYSEMSTSNITGNNRFVFSALELHDNNFYDIFRHASYYGWSGSRYVVNTSNDTTIYDNNFYDNNVKLIRTTGGTTEIYNNEFWNNFLSIYPSSDTNIFNNLFMVTGVIADYDTGTTNGGYFLDLSAGSIVVENNDFNIISNDKTDSFNAISIDSPSYSLYDINIIKV